MMDLVIIHYLENNNLTLLLCLVNKNLTCLHLHQDMVKEEDNKSIEDLGMANGEDLDHKEIHLWIIRSMESLVTSRKCKKVKWIWCQTIQNLILECLILMIEWWVPRNGMDIWKVQEAIKEWNAQLLLLLLFLRWWVFA